MSVGLVTFLVGLWGMLLVAGLITASLWTLLFISEVAASLFQSNTQHTLIEQDEADTSIAILIPAHNEENVIEPALISIKSQLMDKDRLIVIADHCSDKTAATALKYGAEVLVRENGCARGKAGALDHGYRSLKQSPPDTLFVMDADCVLMPNSLAYLRKLYQASRQPIQALNLSIAPAAKNQKSSAKEREFFFRIKNLVRARGLKRLAGCVHFSGTGMLIPWHDMPTTGFKSMSLAEDLELSTRLSLTGRGVLFCEDACVESPMPIGEALAAHQRTRWIHGFLDVMMRFGPKLFITGIKEFNRSKLIMGLDLCIPPLGLFAVFLALLTVATGLSLFFYLSFYPLFLWVIALISLMGIALLLAWWFYGRDLIPAGGLVRLPLKILPSVLTGIKGLRTPETKWEKTGREKEDQEKNQSHFID